MERKTIYSIEGLYRDDFRIDGFTFGSGEKALAVVGNTRGNENQQLYTMALLVNCLKELEKQGCLVPGKEVLVMPSCNPYSMNIKKRFWTIDNTDINRMFPGYDKGETTQRIAAGLFAVVKDYAAGIQMASFYMPGAFVPHVRMMDTGYEDIAGAKLFGMPFVVVHKPRPFDTTTLNYNWQIWETKAFSLYTTNTATVDRKSAANAVEAILRYMSKTGLLSYNAECGLESRVVSSADFMPERTVCSGFFEPSVHPGDYVKKGQYLASIHDTLTYEKKVDIHASVSGVVGFVSDEPMVYQHTAVIKIIKD